MARRTAIGVFTVTSIGLLLLTPPAESSHRGGSTPASSGYLGSSDWAYAVAIQRDGKLVAAGTSNAGSTPSSFRFALARYTTKGRLDPSFGHGGKVVKAGFGFGSELRAVTVQPDGKIITAGGAQVQNGKVPRGVLLRYTARGRPDLSLGQGGEVVTPFEVRALAIQRDGDLVAAGAQRATSAAACSRNAACTEGALARYTVDGALDRAFGTQGKVLTGFDVYALAVQADGRILALGGTLDPVGGTLPGFALARYNADGSLDASFGKDGKVLTSFGQWGAAGAALAIDPNGKIVAAGANEIYTGPVHRFALARYSADGQLDSSFGSRGKVQTHFGRNGCDQPGGSDELAHAVTIQRDGKIVAAGVSNAGGVCDIQTGDKGKFFALVRYTADGEVDRTFGSEGKVLTHLTGFRTSGAEGAVIQADGKIVAAGGGSKTGAFPDFAFARYTARGRLDTTFGRGGKVLTDLGSG